MTEECINLLCCMESIATFSFDTVVAKEKVIKKKSAERNFSTSAEVEEGSAPSTAPPFEKGGRKLFVKR